MKRIVFLLIITTILFSCTESRVKSTAKESVKKQMKDPSSFKAEDVEVILDTIPIFLNHDLLTTAEKVNEALKDVNHYKELDSYLWYDELKKATEDLQSAVMTLGLSYHSAKEKKDKPYEYMVLMNCSGKNSYGGTVSSKYIVIVDKEKTDKVLGEYRIDTDFIEQVMAIYYSVGEGEQKFKENDFGKIDTEGMSRVEQFIFSD